ncbi:alpha-glucan family phosphorylase [Calditrichota bacterium LG25]
MTDRKSLPDKLQPLEGLSQNLWFSWNYEALQLFQSIDAELWESSGHNPVALLQDVSAERLQQLSNDQTFIEKVNRVYQKFENYLQSQPTVFQKQFPDLKDKIVAYFSAEFGVHESLPNYSGGLGILAGDHLKSASDLGLPLVGVGLFYKYAYFNQQLDEHGNQTESYDALDPQRLALKLVSDSTGQPIKISVFLKDHEVKAQIWQADVGRVKLYLLDSNVPENAPADQEITSTLYGGDREMRIRQEILLGIGGIRALRAMGYEPTVIHMNEGHSAFSGLERLRELMEKGLTFEEAYQMVRNSALFTTHTPIPAGNEAFEFDLMRAYFKPFWENLGLGEQQFFDLGRNVNEHKHENFSLTVLALNLSSMANGVSAIHGNVSRAMWKHIFPGIPESEIPIGHITNGIHTETWLHPLMIQMFEKYLGKDWRKNIRNAEYWKKIDDVPDSVFWQTMQEMRKEMADYLRAEYQKRLERLANAEHHFPAPDAILDPNILTIGFARRFAPYKRATLIFKDPERLKKILNDPQRPVQIIFAGKAHPHNDAGKELIRTINRFAQEEGYRGKIVFVEGYSMAISRAMVSGSDVWLNNPRRPLEASGTSGQKVPINGGINLSIMDGWWPEAFNGKNGWAIGDDIEFADPERQDQHDSQSLYELLEKEVVPNFYDRDENGVPLRWVKMAKESLKTIIHQFSTHRMVWEYIEKYYVPGMKQATKLSRNQFSLLKEHVRWLKNISAKWPTIHFSVLSNGAENRIFSAGEERDIHVVVHLDGLKPEEVTVELVLERQDALQRSQNMETVALPLEKNLGQGQYQYGKKVRAKTDGAYRFSCRVLPRNENLLHKHDTRLIKWLD